MVTGWHDCGGGAGGRAVLAPRFPRRASLESFGAIVPRQRYTSTVGEASAVDPRQQYRRLGRSRHNLRTGWELHTGQQLDVSLRLSCRPTGLK